MHSPVPTRRRRRRKEEVLYAEKNRSSGEEMSQEIGLAVTSAKNILSVLWKSVTFTFLCRNNDAVPKHDITGKITLYNSTN
jgi:hypothetical protein